MSKGLALVTGANGFIAGRTIEAFLKAGWNVRGTVRSLKSAGPVKAALAEYGSRAELVEVPDITTPGAFDTALQGVTAVAHLATPVSLQFTDPEPVLRTAANGTLSILESATRTPSVKAFVILSSITAILRRVEGPETINDEQWNDWAEPLVAELGDKAPGRAIYSASKVLAERTFWEFREEHKGDINFSLTAVNPSFVAGPPLVTPQNPEQVSETNAFIWDVLAGKAIETAGVAGFAGVTGSSGYVDVRDVGRIVVFAAEHPAETDGHRYLASAHYAGAQAVADILRKAYPARKDIIQAGTPGQDYYPGYKFGGEKVHDSSKVVKTTGQDFIPFETTVLDTAKAFESLL